MANGKRGPKPTPTPVLRLRGSWRAQTRDGEPDLKQEEVPCPSWVRPDAQQYWPYLCEILRGMGLLSRPYSIAMGMLVNALASYVQFETRARELPTDGMGKMPYVHPVHYQADKAMGRVLDICARFGLDPSSISQVKSVGGEDEESGLEEFMVG